MKLKLLVPTHTLIDEPVSKVIAEADNGSFCLLPAHIDFLANLVPGILVYEDFQGQEHFAAVDRGILVKRGEEVLISTQQAIRGGDLGQLERIVRDQLTELSERERAARTAVGKLELSFLRGYLELTQEDAG